MATILRDWSYRYQWLYDSVSKLAAIGVGGEDRLRRLALLGLPIDANTRVLDMCCGSGQSTQVLVQQSRDVVGLDASPRSLTRARNNVPEANYVESFAEEMPFGEGEFDLVHTSMALHEMEPDQGQQILKEIHRVLKPGGTFAMVDFHRPHNLLFWPGLALFLALFETETAWKLLRLNLVETLENIGFEIQHTRLYGGGSVQVIHAQRQ